MKKDFHRTTRKFLNKKEGLAAIQTEFSSGSWSLGGDIIISDCNRNVNLDFYVHDEKDLTNKLYKLDLLIDELIQYRMLMQDHSTEFFKRKKERNKEEVRVTRQLQTIPIEELLDDK